MEWFWTSIQMDACADERLHMYHTDARLSSYLSPNPGIYSPSTPGKDPLKWEPASRALNSYTQYSKPEGKPIKNICKKLSK